MTAPIITDEIRAVACTLCEKCLSVHTGQSADQAVRGDPFEFSASGWGHSNPSRPSGAAGSPAAV